MSTLVFIQLHKVPEIVITPFIKKKSHHQIYKIVQYEMSFVGQRYIPRSYTKTQLAILAFAIKYLRKRSIIAYHMNLAWSPIEELFKTQTNLCSDVVNIISLYCGIVTDQPLKRHRRILFWMDY